MAARPASATPGRWRSRSRPPSRRTTWSAVAVLSGNRNFEGRIHPLARASYLASPPLVVAFALAGRVDIDLTTEPLGIDRDGRAGHAGRLWPSAEEVVRVVTESVSGEIFSRNYASVFDGDERWRELPVPPGDRYAWDPSSTYVARPPFFERWAEDRLIGRHRRRAGAGACSATASRPTTSRPAGAHRADVAGRRMARRRTASSHATSTRTGRGAAITR